MNNEDEGITTISREPPSFWLGVHSGSQNRNVPLSSPDSFEVRLWGIGYKLGRAGALKPNDEMPAVITALVRKYDGEAGGLTWFIMGVAFSVVYVFVLEHWLS